MRCIKLSLSPTTHPPVPGLLTCNCASKREPQERVNTFILRSDLMSMPENARYRQAPHALSKRLLERKQHGGRAYANINNRSTTVAVRVRPGWWCLSSVLPAHQCACLKLKSGGGRHSAALSGVRTRLAMSSGHAGVSARRAAAFAAAFIG